MYLFAANAKNKLAAAQTKMERSMLNITYKDRRTNIWLMERTKLIDIIYTVCVSARPKFSLAKLAKLNIFV